MDKQKKMQWLGIIIVIVMAVSMIATGFIYNTSPDSGQNNSNPLPTPNTKTFTYQVSFDGKLLKELNSLRFAGTTYEIDKTKIDSAVSKVEGISKVTSSFKKDSFSSTSWVYVAEVTLKRDFPAEKALDSISMISLFDVNSVSGMKYVTVSPPENVSLYNADLNITRDYNFESKTLPALALTGSIPGDELSITGSVQLQGNAILQLELIGFPKITLPDDMTIPDFNLPDNNSP